MISSQFSRAENCPAGGHMSTTVASTTDSTDTRNVAFEENSSKTQTTETTSQKATTPRRRRRIVRGMVQAEDIVVTRMISLSFNLIPIIMITLGITYIDDCPKEPMLPIWLIVLGLLYLFITFLDLLVCFRDDYDRPIAIRILDHLIISLMLGWLILGSVWLYSPSGGSDEQCQPAIYNFSMLLITGTYVFIIFISIILLIIGGTVAVFG